MTFYQNLKIRYISDIASMFSFYAVNEIKLMVFNNLNNVIIVTEISEFVTIQCFCHIVYWQHQ